MGLLLQPALEPESREVGTRHCQEEEKGGQGENGGRERPGLPQGKTCRRQCSDLEAGDKGGIRGPRQAMCVLGSR